MHPTFKVEAGNDTFVVNAANLITASSDCMVVLVNDSVSFGAVLSGSSILGGNDEDTLNFSAGVNNNAIVSGDAGSDLLLFSSTVATAGVYGGTGGNDSMVFAGAISNSTIDFGADNDSVTFSVALTNNTVQGECWVQ